MYSSRDLLAGSAADEAVSNIINVIVPLIFKFLLERYD